MLGLSLISRERSVQDSTPVNRLRSRIFPQVRKILLNSQSMLFYWWNRILDGSGKYSSTLRLHRRISLALQEGIWFFLIQSCSWSVPSGLGSISRQHWISFRQTLADARKRAKIGFLDRVNGQSEWMTEEWLPHPSRPGFEAGRLSNDRNVSIEYLNKMTTYPHRNALFRIQVDSIEAYHMPVWNRFDHRIRLSLSLRRRKNQEFQPKIVPVNKKISFLISSST